MSAISNTRITIDVRNCPEVIAEVRAELARMVRRVAREEPVPVCHRLLEIADAFDAGQSVPTTEEEQG